MKADIPNTSTRGAQAEEQVVLYLERRHPDFRLIGRNVRFKCGEIDIVYENILPSGARELVFVEVKSSHESMKMAVWNFTPQKRMKMNRAVQVYLSQYSGRATEMRMELAVCAGVETQLIPIY
ncbi:MAG: YraN family protein [Xanthomonadaceae bacterium]|nr:YraN family protein [Xanthomonadaceae bacterium]